MADIFEVRSSSWAELFDCPLRWEAKHLKGMTLPATRAMHLGTSIHQGTRVYDQCRLDVAPISPEDAEDAFIETFRHPEEEVVPTDSDMAPGAAESVGRNLVRGYCQTVAPLFSYRAVEIRPEPLDVEVEDITLRLTGQLDRLRVVNAETGGLGIADIKTGKTAVTPRGVPTKGHAMQLGVYELLTEYSLQEEVTEPATIIGMQTTKAARIGFGRVMRPRNGLVGSADSPGLIQMAARMLREGVFPPNPRSILCHERYCPNWNCCPYH